MDTDIKQEIIDEGYCWKQPIVDTENGTNNAAFQSPDISCYTGNLVCKEESEDGSRYEIYLQNNAERNGEENNNDELSALNTGNAQQAHTEMFIDFNTINNAYGRPRDGPIFPDIKHNIPVPHYKQNEIQSTNMESQNKDGNSEENDKEFQHERRLQEHERETLEAEVWQPSDKDFECSYCGKIFMKENTFKKHLLNHNISDSPESPPKKVRNRSKNKEAKLFCDVCNKGFLYKSDLERHYSKHLDTKPYKCDVKFCEASYKLKRSLNAHILSKHANEKVLNIKQFKCPQCPMVFISQSRLEAHKPAHNATKQFVCNLCGNEYQYPQTLNEHMRLHESDNPTKCQYCGVMFESGHKLKVHMLENAGDGLHNTTTKSHTCEICGKVFSASYRLKRHYLSHTDERNFQCTICGLRFKQLAHLKGHTKTHERENKINTSNSEKKEKPGRKIPCSKCHLVFRTKRELELHLYENANDGLHCLHEKHTCKDCGKVFNLKESLDGHLQWHLEKRSFECSICKMSFKTIYHLKGHMGTHITLMDSACVVTCMKDGEEKTMFACKECNTDFPTRKKLKMHMIDRGGDELHTRPTYVTSYQCEICDSVFTGNSGLIIHQKVHQEKRYKCNICGEEFDQSEDLLQHGFIHKNEKKAQEKVNCNICNKEFNKRSELSVHIIESIGDGIHKNLNTYMSRGQSSNCKICGKFVPSKGGMKVHMLRSHTQKTNDNKNLSAVTPSMPTSSKNTCSVDIMMQNDLQAGNYTETPMEPSPRRERQNEKEQNSPMSNVNTGDKNGETPDRENQNQKEQSSLLIDTNTEDKNGETSQNSHSNLPQPHKQNQELLYKSILDDKIVYTHNGIRYKCSECPKLLKSMNCVKTHMRIHQKNITCEKCGKNFYHQRELEEHINNQYPCSICQERFCKVLEFKKHNRNHRKEKIMQCQYCPKKFLSEIQYAGHLSTHTGSGLFDCELCNLKFKNKSVLDDHMRRHTNDRKYLCDICGKKFINKTGLNNHHKIHDKIRKVFKCDQCDKQYHQKFYLKYHINVEHNNFRCKCKICGKTFSHLNSLKVHERKHTGIKPFECNVCNKKFFTKNFLQVHSIVHTKLKTFECDICGKTFSQKACINRHKKVNACVK